MAIIATLFMRNLGVFLRNRTALVFAVAPVALCILFLVFFRPQTTVLISDYIPASGQVHAATDAWIFASVAMLSAFTSSASVLIGFMEDRLSGRFGLQLASSVKRWQLVCGYLLSAVTVSVAVSIVIVLFGQIWALAAGHPAMGIGGWFLVILGVLLSALLFTGLNAIALKFMASQGAFGAYCLIMGTVAGLLSYSYALPQPGVGRLSALLPFLQAGACVRTPMIAPALRSFGATPADQDSVSYLLGATLNLGGPWPTGLTILVLLVWTILANAGGFFLLNREIETETKKAV